MSCIPAPSQAATPAGRPRASRTRRRPSRSLSPTSCCRACLQSLAPCSGVFLRSIPRLARLQQDHSSMCGCSGCRCRLWGILGVPYRARCIRQSLQPLPQLCDFSMLHPAICRLISADRYFPAHRSANSDAWQSIFNTSPIQTWIFLPHGYDNTYHICISLSLSLSLSLYIYIYIYMYIYIYIHMGAALSPPPCFLTTLQSTKRHGVQARSHLYTIMQHNTRKHMVYCMLYCCSDIWESFVIVSYIFEYVQWFVLVFYLFISFPSFPGCPMFCRESLGITFPNFQVFQYFATNLRASFVHVCQVSQHFANNIWAPIFCVKCWKT